MILLKLNLALLHLRPTSDSLLALPPHPMDIQQSYLYLEPTNTLVPIVPAFCQQWKSIVLHLAPQTIRNQQQQMTLNSNTIKKIKSVTQMNPSNFWNQAVEQAITFTQLPFYLILSPLCTISSSLFQSAAGIKINQPTFWLITALIAVWGCSAILIWQLIISRSHKQIFFYEFVVCLSLVNFCLIGVTYSMLQRQDPIYTLTLILSCQRVVVATKLKQKQCGVCFNDMITIDNIVLKCGHSFHEKCLWDWMYRHKGCPCCPWNNK